MSVTDYKIDGSSTSVTYKYDNNGNQLYALEEQLNIKKEDVKPTLGMFISGQSTTVNAQEFFESTTVNVYNEFNKLIKTTVGDKRVNNVYNGEGYRVKKSVNDVATNYVYIADIVILELDSNGKKLARNIHGLTLISRKMNTESYHYLFNGQGDVVSLLKPDGTIRVSYYYDAFGVVL